MSKFYQPKPKQVNPLNTLCPPVQKSQEMEAAVPSSGPTNTLSDDVITLRFHMSNGTSIEASLKDCSEDDDGKFLSCRLLDETRVVFNIAHIVYIEDIK